MIPNYGTPRRHSTTPTPNKQPWRDQALCSRHPNLSQQAGNQLDSKTWHNHQHEAPAVKEHLELCHHCPVTDACLNFAMTTADDPSKSGKWGIYGGLLPIERHQLAQATRKAA